MYCLMEINENEMKNEMKFSLKETDSSQDFIKINFSKKHTRTPSFFLKLLQIGISHFVTLNLNVFLYTN